MHEMKKLIGKTIEDVSMNPEHTMIGFRTVDGEKLLYYTEGDCCSSSWIEHTENVDQLHEATVTKIETVPMPETREEDGDFIQFYGVKIHVEKQGRPVPAFFFEFRNRSNGYYGGMLVECDVDQWKDMLLITKDL